MNHLQTLQNYITHLEHLGETASKGTHYHGLDEWFTPAGEFVHQALTDAGFKNGDKTYNEQYPGIQFWWHIYGLYTNVCYSRYLQTEVPNHHSSAFERNAALILDLKANLVEAEALGEQA
jgi:hypothetical protein